MCITKVIEHTANAENPIPFHDCRSADHWRNFKVPNESRHTQKVTTCSNMKKLVINQKAKKPEEQKDQKKKKKGKKKPCNSIGQLFLGTNISPQKTFWTDQYRAIRHH